MSNRTIAIIVLLLSSAALAEEPPGAEVGFSGLYRSGPVAIRVPLRNDGPVGEVGDLVVQVNDGLAQARYAVRVDLGPGARKMIVVHAWLSETSFLARVAFPATITWNPVGKPAREIPASNAREITVGDNLVVFASGDPIERGISLPGLSGRAASAPAPVVVPPKIANNPSFAVTTFTVGGVTQQSPIDPAQISETWYDLSSVDVLYLRRLSKSDISDPQLEAIASWMEAGGEVVISGGSAPLGPLERFVPGRLKGKTARSTFDGFTKIYGEVKPEPHELSVVSPEAGADVACLEGDLPLVTYARRGAGTVAFLSFDPLAEPFRSSPGLSKLWDGIIARSGRHYSPWNDRHLQEDVVDLLGARQGPTMGTVVAGASVLVLFLAGLWWVHRRIAAQPTRLALAVFASPLLALCAACVAWTLGLFSRGGDRHDAAVFLQAAPGARHAVVHSFDAFWHGGAGTFEEAALVRDHLCVGEVSPIFDPRQRPRLTWREETPPRLADAEFYPNSSRIFGSLLQADLGDGIEGTLTRSPSGLEGPLTNRTPWDWKDVRLLAFGSETRLGDLPRGKQVLTASPDWVASPERAEARISAAEMARGGKLHDGLVERLHRAWIFPNPTATPGVTARGDLLLVAFVDAVPVWSTKDGRKETQETVIVVPLAGCDHSGGGTGR